MAELLTVGEFSRLTHLTVKALHHYHESGVLRPVQVDTTTGYRYYSPHQLADAQLVRRLRQVRMPLAEVRAVLASPGPVARRTGIAAHLARLRGELVATAAAVASLQALLTSTGPATSDAARISYRLVPDQPCLALREDVEHAAISAWCAQAYPRLGEAAARAGLPIGSPAGALYDEGWFELGGGEVTAYLPLPRTPDDDTAGRTHPGTHPTGTPTDGVRLTRLPAQAFAVMVHPGPFEDLDRSYAALGRHVVEHDLGARGAVREVYLVTPADTHDPGDLRPEVCWPITRIPEEN